MSAFEIYEDSAERLNALEIALCDLDDLTFHLARGGLSKLAWKLAKLAGPLDDRVEKLKIGMDELFKNALLEWQREREQEDREYIRCL